MPHDHELRPQEWNAAKPWLILYTSTFAVTILGSIAALAYFLFANEDASAAVASGFLGALVVIIFVRWYCGRRLRQIELTDARDQSPTSGADQSV